FRVPAGTEAGRHKLTVVLASGAPLGPGSEIDLVTLPAATPPPPPAPAPRLVPADPSGFTHGGEQRGVVGTTLPDPLVFEVRDSAGRPIAGAQVAFTTVNGSVTPLSAESDATGTVWVRVTLGERAGPVAVTARVGALTKMAAVRADPGPVHELVVERNGMPVTDSLFVRSRDSVVLRVVARDAHGNGTVLKDFTATASGGAVALRSTATQDSQALVTLEPRRNGTGELQLSASEITTRIPVKAVVPVGPIGPWAISLRSAWLGANSPWVDLPSLTGLSGEDFTVFVRRIVAPAFSVAVGGGVGSLTADQPTGSVSLELWEGYAQGELTPAVRGRVRPVLSIGVGLYRLKSGDGGQTLSHTNFFWSGGAGIDLLASPQVTVEFRAEREWMRDTNLGHVATLWPLAAGVRVGL
ncbi:MAG TPA: Ig-like domain-containing protein, partial [bacterium]|nr:Ig-like domain-containing protein [bacterium]